MRFETQLRDCLFLNWALDAECLPDPPGSLRWEKHRGKEGDFVFASALIFRQEGLRWSASPLPRLSYPQLNLRLYVFDEDDVASVLFWMMLVPHWVVPAVRWIARQPAAPARFSLPGFDAVQRARSTWTVRRHGGLVVSAKVGSAGSRGGPDLGSFHQLVTCLRMRKRGYSWSKGALRKLEAKQPEVEAIPMDAEIESLDLLPTRMQGREIHWPELHSAFFCPQMPYIFDVGPSLAVPVPRPRTASLGNCTHGATRRMG